MNQAVTSFKRIMKEEDEDVRYFERESAGLLAVVESGAMDYPAGTPKVVCVIHPG